jgi:hypothetical protein
LTQRSLIRSKLHDGSGLDEGMLLVQAHADGSTQLVVANAKHRQRASPTREDSRSKMRREMARMIRCGGHATRSRMHVALRIRLNIVRNTDAEL